MLIILLLTFWYATIQYRKGKLKWIFLVYMFFKTDYIWLLLRYVTFHVQTKIGLHVMSPTLESFNRPFMRLWFYTAFIQIEFGSSVWSFHSNYTIKYLFWRSHAVALWKFWVYEYSIRFQVIEFKLLCETFKNEKFLFDIHTKCGDIRLRNPKCGDWHWTNFQMPKYLLWRFGFLECSTIGTVHKTFCLCKDDPEPFRDAIRRGSYGFLCVEVISKT